MNALIEINVLMETLDDLQCEGKFSEVERMLNEADVENATVHELITYVFMTRFSYEHHPDAFDSLYQRASDHLISLGEDAEAFLGRYYPKEGKLRD